jgi:hypothetical protein
MATSPVGGAGNTSPIQYHPETSTSKHQSRSTDNPAASPPNTAGAQLSDLREISKKRSLSPDAGFPESKHLRVASPAIKQEQESNKPDKSELPVVVGKISRSHYASKLNIDDKKFQNIKALAKFVVEKTPLYGRRKNFHRLDVLESLEKDDSYENCTQILRSFGVGFEHPSGENSGA